MEDWNEGDEQSRLLGLLPEAWSKRLTKEEAKRAKSTHTVKMMLRKHLHKRVVSWTRANVARDARAHSLRKSLLIAVQSEREKATVSRLDEHEVGGQTICLQAIPARMRCGNMLEWVSEEVLKEYKNHHHNRGWQGQNDRGVHGVWDDPDDPSPKNPPDSNEVESAGGPGGRLQLVLMRLPPNYLSKLGWRSWGGGGGGVGGRVGGGVLAAWPGGGCAQPTTIKCIPQGGVRVHGGTEVCMR